jgi:hypothetical protein
MENKIYTDVKYFSKISGSRFIFSDGTEAFFHFGRLVINAKNFPGIYKAPHKEHPQTVDSGRPKWQVYQDELDAVLGVNPNIFTEASLQTLEKVEEKVPQNAATEAEVAAGEAALTGAGTVKVSQEIGAAGSNGQPTNVNESTIDAKLAKAQQNASVVGPGAAVAERVAAARQAAQANAAAASSVSK